MIPTKKEEKKYLNDIPLGTLLRVKYKDKRPDLIGHFLGIQGNQAIINQSNGTEGFVLLFDVGHRDKYNMIVAEAVFPSSIKTLDDEVTP